MENKDVITGLLYRQHGLRLGWMYSFAFQSKVAKTNMYLSNGFVENFCSIHMKSCHGKNCTTT